MQNKLNKLESRKRPIPLSMILLFGALAMVAIDAVVLLGVLQMSNSLQIAVVAMAFVLILFGALFSVTELVRNSRASSQVAEDE